MRKSLPPLVVVLLACFVRGAVGSDFTVTTEFGSGAGSLYQAVTDANNSPGPHRILFNIPGPGVHKIDLRVSQVPGVLQPVLIDGYSQPGAKPNTLSVGDDAVILIQLDAFTNFQNPSSGLFLDAPNCVVRGLSFTFLGVDAIYLSHRANGSSIEGNFIGLAPDGQTAGRNGTGIHYLGDLNPNLSVTIGGTQPAARNLIGNCPIGVNVTGKAVIQGNYIGTDRTGTKAAGNQRGIFMVATAGVSETIGGTTAGAGNLISGNQLAIQLGDSYPSNFGTVYRPASNVTIQGNLIGTQADGQSRLGNDVAILVAVGDDELIGGTAPGAGNVIAFNRGNAVAFGTGRRTQILSNKIYGNAYPPIAGTQIDRQSDPVFSSITRQNGSVTLSGTVMSDANTTVLLQFFADANSFIDPGQTFLGEQSVVTDNNGNANFSASFPISAPDVRFTATATATAHGTSRFTPTGARFRNLSTRGLVGTGQNILIAGIIERDPTRTVFRALGPSLSSLLPPGTQVVPDPTLELHYPDDFVSSNDNWGDDFGKASEIAALGLAPPDQRESALVAFTGGGRNTALFQGKGDATGLGLIELYDLPTGPGEGPDNLSTRGFVGTGDNIMIGGFIVGDSLQKTRVILRALGPSLANFGITAPLLDPTIEMRDHNGAILASNDNWHDEGQAAAEIAAAGLAPAFDAESALCSTLGPGAYTAIVRGKGNSSGTALVEIYNLR